MIRSRLSRRTEQKTKKTFILSILGIIITLLFAFKFGIPLLVNMSMFLSGSKNSQEQSKIQKPDFIPAPALNSLPEATSSANIVITGLAAKDQTITLYVNGTLTDETDTEDDGTFSFKETISAGENIIKVKAVVKNKESDFSNSFTVALKSAPPSLNTSSPENGQSFSKDQNTIEVNGTTDPDVKVTVNGFWAIVDDSGNYSYNLLLHSGENSIKIIATDLAGNSTEKEIKVTYSP